MMQMFTKLMEKSDAQSQTMQEKSESQIQTKAMKIEAIAEKIGEVPEVCNDGDIRSKALANGCPPNS